MIPADEHTPARTSAPAPGHGPTGRKTPWFLIAASVCFVATLIIALIAYNKTVDKVGDAVADLSNAFSHEEITETFLVKQVTKIIRRLNGARQGCRFGCR